MKGKIIQGLGSLFLLSVLLVGLASAQTTSSTSSATGALSLTNLQINPAPVVAGDNITVGFQLFNSYSQSLSQVNLQLEAQNPILNVSPSYSYLIDSIGTGEYGGLGNDYFIYKLHVPSTLPAGEYTIDVVAQYQTNEGTGAGTAIAAESVIPIYIYVYGAPQISLNIFPTGQIIPARDFTATLSAVNGGTDTARNVSVQILASNSFAPNGPSTFQLGIIPAGGSSSATASIFTSQNITGGLNYLTARLSYITQEGSATNTVVSVPIDILLNNPQIVTSIVGAIPPQVYPGANQTLTMLIQNVGSGQADNLTVNFLSSNGIGVSGTASSFFIGALAAGAETTETVFISASSTLGQMSASLPVQYKYSYENYRGNVVADQNVTLNLVKSAIFNITSFNGSVTPGGSYQRVAFTVQNTGNEQAQEITFSLQSTYPITPVTPDFYVESLAPGQSANVVFYVDTGSNGAPGAYPVTLYEQWRQPNGYITQQFSSSSGYYMQVSNASSISSTDQVIIAAIVVVLAAFIGYRFMKKRAKKEKHKLHG